MAGRLVFAGRLVLSFLSWPWRGRHRGKIAAPSGHTSRHLLSDVGLTEDDLEVTAQSIGRSDQLFVPNHVSVRWLARPVCEDPQGALNVKGPDVTPVCDFDSSTPPV